MSADLKCKNCDATLSGQFCSACGQVADTRIPSLGALFTDALGDLFNFDSRIWGSVTLLLFKPGRLTREYLEGRRARYVPPFRMYLVLIFAFFLASSLPEAGDGPEERGPAADAVPHPGPDVGAGLSASEYRGGIWTPGGVVGGWSCDPEDAADLSPETYARFREACEKIAADSGSSFSRALFQNIPLMMLFFIPIVAGIMKVLYPLAGRKYVEHLLFFLHFHAFFFLLGTIGVLLSRLAGLVPVLDGPVMLLSIAGWIYLPVYLFMAMRQVYGQGRLVTTFKYVLLGNGYLASLMVTLLGVLAYTALTL